MSDDEVNQIFNIPIAELGSIASQVLGVEAVVLGNVSPVKIGRSFGSTTLGIYRVVGQARTAAGDQPWSAVAKVLTATEKPSAEAVRELEVYRSGVFAELPGLRSARCYGIQERDGVQILWLEDLSSAPQAPWIPKYYLEAARHLGQFNAHWPEPALPEWAWLDQRSFTQSFRQAWYSNAIERLPDRQSEPLVGHLARADTPHRHINLWRKSADLFPQVELTAKGICHLDCHPKNLFPVGTSGPQSATVAIDWASVGVGCLGVDVGHLLASPIAWLEISVDQAAPLVEPIFEAYLRGLQQAGWTGNEEQVRLTYLTRLGCQANRIVAFALAAADNPQLRATTEKFVGQPLEDSFEQWANALPFLLSQTDQALALASRL